jgi:hypothetical protein
MFHITDNFQPGAPITQVPASWFNKVASFLNNLIGDGVKVDKSDTSPSVIRIDENAVAKKLSEVGTPVDGSDTNADDDQDGSTWTWAAGGDNGLVVTPYCEVEEDGGFHYFGRVQLTFSKSGLLVSAQKLAGRKEITA